MADSTPTIVINRDRCFGSGECVMALPRVFQLDAEDLSKVRDDADLSAVSLDRLAQVAAMCPSAAISLTSVAD